MDKYLAKLGASIGEDVDDALERDGEDAQPDLFDSDDGSDEEVDGSFDDDDDGESDAVDESDDEDDVITSETIKKMSFIEIVSLIKEYGLDVDISKYEDNKKGLKKLRKKVGKIVDEYDDEGSEDADVADSEDEEEGYTREELENSDTSVLKSIYLAWNLGKFPDKGSEEKRREKAIKKILDSQG